VLPPDTGEATLDLAAKHNPRSRMTLSQTLLSALGMWGVEVLEKTRLMQTRQFSLRELSKLFIIDEQRMIDPHSPAIPTITSNPFVTTLEKSIFRYLVTGDDDAGLVARDNDDVARTSQMRSDVLDQVVAKIAEGLAGYPAREDLEAQYEQITTSIDDLSVSVQTGLDARQRRMSDIQERSEFIHQVELQIAERRELYARFRLLQQQYASDLERLEMVDEAGTLLGLFNLEICPICGASSEHQHRHVTIQNANGNWAEAVHSEIAVTKLLAADLGSTIDAVLQEIASLEATVLRNHEDLSALTADVQRIEHELSPELATLEELAQERSRIERGLYAYGSLRDIETLKASPQSVESPEVPTLDLAIDEELISALCQTVSNYLIAWGIDGGRAVRFDQDEYELIVDGRPRSARGKGMRAITHAAFTLALCQYGFDVGQSAFGFAILDSPIVTYREADHETVKRDEDEYVPESVAQRFYQSVATNFSGQAIVLENIDPTDVTEGMEYIKFTKDAKFGRAGFL
jgi:hypothetical protein